MTASVDDDAKAVWEYLQLHHTLKKCDAILVLGTMDLRVPEYAAELYLKGLGEYVVISGGTGWKTPKDFTKPEADIFADIAVARGVPAGKIIIENKSTNTGENIRFTHKILQKRGLRLGSLIIVQKPFMERRVYATFKKQWPDPNTKILTSSPPIDYDDYFDAANPKELVLSIMAGDMQRIRQYPKLGYQIEQNIPDEVWQANERLIAAGYDQHLIST